MALALIVVALPFAAGAQGAPEARTVAAFVRFGVRNAPSHFESFRERPVTFGPQLTHCAIADEGGEALRLSCISIDHSVSVEALGEFLRSAVRSSLPRSLNRFACDSDSVQGYYLAWESATPNPLYVAAYVSAHAAHSYYTIEVTILSASAMRNEGALPPESALNNCSWAVR